jgi:hypothetical protein
VAYPVLDAASAEQMNFAGSTGPMLEQRKPSTQSQ